MKVTIGIPTYNRKELLVIMGNSLYQSNLGEYVNIRIYDDCSEAFNSDFLKEVFPTAKSIQVNSKNLKSDKNIYQMYVDFLKSDDDYFFNADSDIIFNKTWLQDGLQMIKKTNGILSLFNANSHPVYQVLDNEICIKRTVGSAGTLFSRERVLEIVNQFNTIEKVNSFDWQWCSYFLRKSIPIHCVLNSRIQHIGYFGQNSKLYFDVGLNYKIESIAQGQIMNDILERSISSIRIKEKNRNSEFQRINAQRSNDFGYHFKRCCIIMTKKILTKKIFLKIKNK